MLHIVAQSLNATYQDRESLPTCPTRIARFHRTRQAIDRNRMCLADGLITQALGARGSHGHSYTPWGQPRAHDTRWHISASHDGSWVAAATSATHIGIDIVEIRRAAGLAVESVLSESEMAVWGLLEPDERPLRLAQSWAVKEAYLKRSGVGLIVAPTALRLSWPATDRVTVHGPHPRQRGSARTARLDDEHLLAFSDTTYALSTHTITVQPALPEQGETP